ncbi:MAG: triose-phosphate isomerase, partial [Oscillospiraceae bacterium]
MNKGPIEALGLVQDLRPMLKGLSSDVVLCVPYIDLPILVSELQETKIMLGAQNCHWEEKGAFTGEVSATML